MLNWKVIKLGGSLLSPYETASRSLQLGQLPFDTVYARELLEEVKKTNARAVIVVGGGFLNRWYLQQFKEAKFEKPETQNDFHVLGMAASDINATLFRILAGEVLGYEVVYPNVVKYEQYAHLQEMHKDFEKYQIIVAAGWKPGHSHDVDALLFASLLQTKQVLSFKNIDGIYTADPRKVATARKKKKMTWQEYRMMIGTSSHKPGASFPVDAVAAKLAEKMGYSFIVIDGRDIRAVHEILTENGTTRGTILS